MQASRRAVHRLLVLTSLSALLLCSACGYSFTGSLPSHLNTVRIIPFRSRVTEYGLEQEVTTRVTEMLVRDGRLAVVTDEQDSQIEGMVSMYNRSPYSYTSSEQVEEYKIELRVEVTFTDLRTESNILNTENISTWVVYDPETESEQVARARLLEEAAEEIVRRCLSGW